MNVQNLAAAFGVRVVHDDLAVEAARSRQGRVQHIGPVGRRHQNDAQIRIEAVHLDEQLVQGLLALVVPAAKTRAAMTAHGVNFVNEHNGRTVRFGLVEQVAHTRCADADEHLHEVRTRNMEKRHAGLARDGARQQRFARARITQQQHAARNLRAQRLELVRVLQKVNDFLQLLLGLVHAGDIGEGDARLRVGKPAGAAFTEGHRLPRSALALAHDKNPEADEQEQRQQHPDDRTPGAAHEGAIDFSRRLVQRFVQFLIAFPARRQKHTVVDGVVGLFDRSLIACDVNFAEIARRQLLVKLTIVQVFVDLAARQVVLENQAGDQHQRDQHQH